jgi:hypothetical protein
VKEASRWSGVLHQVWLVSRSSIDRDTLMLGVMQASTDRRHGRFSACGVDLIFGWQSGTPETIKKRQ